MSVAIIAHRGACKYAPENTLAAIRKAIELGVDGVELDVQLTRDKVPVLIHEQELSAHTTTYDLISQAPLRALESIDVGSSFSTEFAGEHIPTLAQAFDLLAEAPQVHIHLELKPQPYWHIGLESKIGALVTQYGLQQRVTLSSFNPLSLIRCRQFVPELPRAMIVQPRPFLFLQTRVFAKLAKISGIHPSWSVVQNEPMWEYITQQGWDCNVWTINKRPQMESLLKMGVTGIITDDPVLLQQVTRELPHGD